MEPIIEIKNLSKRYQINRERGGYVALRDVITQVAAHPLTMLRSKAKSIIGKNTKEPFFALKDINLSVGKGEVVGIIGKNGAGKSTLLKILTGITPPTEGEARLRGKVASLLEVGTGFHPELTGRENIYLNGAILGMTRKEIAKKFDQIVEFSGIGKFLDTPVKRYSSGMYVRLAFSVAAHLEPDILLVDEVLAVGDAEFQKKCLGKMDEVTKQAGRTIIFVSHNMDAVSRLCKTTLLLDQGKVVAYGDTDEVIERYLSGGFRDDAGLTLPQTDGEVTMRDFSILQHGKEAQSIDGGSPFQIRLDFSIAQKLKSFRAGIFLSTRAGTLISRSFVQDYAPALEEIAPGNYRTILTVPAKLLMAGDYEVEAKLFCFGVKSFFDGKKIQQSITVHTPKEYNELKSKSGTKGYFLIPAPWTIDSKNHHD